MFVSSDVAEMWQERAGTYPPEFSAILRKLRNTVPMSSPSTNSPSRELAEINAVYQQLGLASASDRAYFAAMDPRPLPSVQMTVHIGSTSLPSN